MNEDLAKIIIQQMVSLGKVASETGDLFDEIENENEKKELRRYIGEILVKSIEVLEYALKQYPHLDPHKELFLEWDKLDENRKLVKIILERDIATKNSFEQIKNLSQKENVDKGDDLLLDILFILKKHHLIEIIDQNGNVIIDNFIIRASLSEKEKAQYIKVTGEGKELYHEKYTQPDWENKRRLY